MKVKVGPVTFPEEKPAPVLRNGKLKVVVWSPNNIQVLKKKNMLVNFDSENIAPETPKSSSEAHSSLFNYFNTFEYLRVEIFFLNM